LSALASVSVPIAAVELGLAGFTTVQATVSQIAEFRKNPVLPPDRSLPAGFLKNSDEQTVLALAAVSGAIISLKQTAEHYGRWGIVAAPNLFGRCGIYGGQCDYRREGAWGISPHLIPHRSLHAVSGTISQALGLHGPNFGIGGGPNAAGEAFLSAATLLSENRLPGLWVVLTGHEPECLPNVPDRQTSQAAVCLAAVLALKPAKDADDVGCLRVCGAGEPSGVSRRMHLDAPEFRLPEFVAALESDDLQGRWALPGCGWVEIECGGLTRGIRVAHPAA
jgi:hypothetical protein